MGICYDSGYDMVDGILFIVYMLGFEVTSGAWREFICYKILISC